MFYKKVHIKRKSKWKDVLVIFVLQQRRIPTVLKRASNVIFNMKKVDLDEP